MGSSNDMRIGNNAGVVNIHTMGKKHTLLFIYYFWEWNASIVIAKDAWFSSVELRYASEQ